MDHLLQIIGYHRLNPHSTSWGRSPIYVRDMHWILMMRRFLKPLCSKKPRRVALQEASKSETKFTIKVYLLTLRRRHLHAPCSAQWVTSAWVLYKHWNNWRTLYHSLDLFSDSHLLYLTAAVSLQRVLIPRSRCWDPFVGYPVYLHAPIVEGFILCSASLNHQVRRRPCVDNY